MKHFGACRLDTQNQCLWRDGVLLNVPPKPYAVLLYLVEHADRLVTHDELMEALWPETYVQPQVLRTYVLELRRLLGDDAAEPRFIATVPKRGYRFLTPVTEGPPKASGKTARVDGQHNGHQPGDLTRPDSRPELVGREGELANLEALLGWAGEGERQVVFITGDPGIGKSALLDAFCDRACEGAKVARGQSVEGFGAREPYYPVKELLNDLCGTDKTAAGKGDKNLRLLERIAPSWYGPLANRHKAESRPEASPLSRNSARPFLNRGGAPDSAHSSTSATGRPRAADVESPATATALMERAPEAASNALPDRMLTEICEALEAMAQDTALLLAFEDLHWSDQATLDLFSALARRRGAAKLALVATYRPGDMKEKRHPLRALKQDLVLRKLCTVIDLKPLKRPAVAEYLHRELAARHPSRATDSSTAPAALPDGLAAFVHQHSTGNPLFMVAMLEHLIVQRALLPADSGWRLRVPLEKLDLGVPDGLCEMIEFEVEALSEADQRLLEAGSIVGNVFPVWAAAPALAGRVTDPNAGPNAGPGPPPTPTPAAPDAEEMEEQYEALARRVHFIRAAGHDELPNGARSTSYVFAHAFYREVLYHRQPEVRRSRGHLRVAESLRRIFAGSETSVAAEIAAHFEAAGDWARAAQTLAELAADYVKRGCIDDGAQHLQRGIALLENLGVKERAPLERDLRQQLEAIVPPIRPASKETPPANGTASPKKALRKPEKALSR